MASKNAPEGIAEIVKEMRQKADQADLWYWGIVDASHLRDYANSVESAHKREVENVRALAKELADALGNRIDCRSECDGCSMPSCTNKANRALVAKARKALEGAENG